MIRRSQQMCARSVRRLLAAVCIPTNISEIVSSLYSQPAQRKCERDVTVFGRLHNSWFGNVFTTSQ